MLKTALKTTSALALCAGLVTPPALAQQTKADLPLCALTDGGATFPCVLDDGKRIKNAKALARELAARAIEAQTGEAPSTGEQPAPEVAPAEQPAADVDQTPSTAPSTVPVDAPAERPAAPDVAAPEPVVDPVTETPPTAPVEAEAGSTKPKSKPVAQTAPVPVAPADAPRTGAGGRKQAAAAAAAALDDELMADPAAGKVTTETVTEATTRQSDEDFATAPSAAAEAGQAAAARAGGGDDSFQKGLLIGLGALAVGAILYNGAKVLSNSGDRVVVEEPDGTLTVLKNDDEILRRPGSEVRTQTYDDGSTRTVVTRENGVRIVTVRAADGTALKRVRVLQNGERYVLFDDTVAVAPIETLPAPQPAAAGITATDQDALRDALIASMAGRDGRRYGLGQVRAYQSVRALAPEIEVRAITFPTNSAAIPPAQAERLADLGLAIAEVIYQVPGAVFLVEGHTDAVGSAAYNLALSDRRAESVALALGEYFGVPPENLITQGYGESDLKVDTQEENRQNRRVVVRNITPLLQ